SVWRCQTRKKGAALKSKLVENKSCSIHSLSQDRSEVIGYYRFLNNQKVDEEEIIRCMGLDCENKIKGKQIITIIDTTEINCSSKNNRIVNEEGLGFLSDNRTKGFLVHPGYCLDANTLEPLGIAGARMIARQAGGSLIAHELRDITNKESDKWFSEPKKLRDGVLKEAAHNVFVFDCEADIYEVLSEIKNETTDFVI